MAKKHLTKKEKEARTKKFLLILLIVFAAAAVAATVAGIVVSGIVSRREAEERKKAERSYTYLRSSMEEACRNDPWDKNDPDGVTKKEGEVWAYFEMLMAIEDDAMHEGSKGIEYGFALGNTLCADLTAVSEGAKDAVEAMLADYCNLKDLSFRTGTLEDLKREGRIDASSADLYLDGILLRPGALKEENSGGYSAFFTFHSSNRNARGAEVFAARKDRFTGSVEDSGFRSTSVLSDDGVWIAFVRSTLVS